MGVAVCVTCHMTTLTCTWYGASHTQHHIPTLVSALAVEAVVMDCVGGVAAVLGGVKGVAAVLRGVKGVAAVLKGIVGVAAVLVGVTLVVGGVVFPFTI